MSYTVKLSNFCQIKLTKKYKKYHFYHWKNFTNCPPLRQYTQYYTHFLAGQALVSITGERGATPSTRGGAPVAPASSQAGKKSARSRNHRLRPNKENEVLNITEPATGGSLDRSPSVQKISPLQQYILEQAKLSGYRFGDRIAAEKRDSYIDSENESHRTGESHGFKFHQLLLLFSQIRPLWISQDWSWGCAMLEITNRTGDRALLLINIAHSFKVILHQWKLRIIYPACQLCWAFFYELGPWNINSMDLLQIEVHLAWPTFSTLCHSKPDRFCPNSQSSTELRARTNWT